MPKTMLQQIKLTPRYNSRIRLIISAVGFVIVAGGFSAYGLYAYHPKLVTISDPITSSPTASKKIPGTAPAKTTLSAAPTTPIASTVRSAPSPDPSAVVTPSSSSDVPSLMPTSSQSSTTSYQSTNWAGYLANSGNFTSVSGTWVAPNPTATSSSVESGDGTWVGIGGVTSSDLIQVGTANTVSSSGVVSTTGFYELLPAGAQATPALTIHPGDTLSASIIRTALTQWTISMTNVTSGQTFSTSVTYSSSLSSAEWIQEDPSYQNGDLVLLDNFGTVRFSNVTTTSNGTTMSASAIGASAITMIGQGGTAGHGGRPGALSGDSFAVSYY
jgi:hypothetical protein